MSARRIVHAASGVRDDSSILGLVNEWRRDRHSFVRPSHFARQHVRCRAIRRDSHCVRLLDFANSSGKFVFSVERKKSRSEGVDSRFAVSKMRRLARHERHKTHVPSPEKVNASMIRGVDGPGNSVRIPLLPRPRA